MKTKHEFQVGPNEKRNGTINFKILFALFTLSLFSQLAIAQLNILNSSMRMVEAGGLQVNGIMNIEINDTLNCSLVQVEIIDELNGGILLNHDFSFDQTNGLPQGMSWSRKGNLIELVLGTFQADSIWKARIKLKDLTGNWTSWYEIIFN